MTCLLAVNIFSSYYLNKACDIIHVLFERQCFTVAKPSKDAVNNPPIVKVKTLLPLCNKNNINFCTCKGTKYHGMLYLQKNNIGLVIW